MSRWKKFNDDDVPDDFVLPPGDVLRGRLLFKKHCAQCHVIEKDETPQTGCTLALEPPPLQMLPSQRLALGPNLYGVYGRTAGTGPRTSLIDSSQAIKDSGIVWTDITLMRYLKNPRQFTQHPMSMNFRGMDNWQDRIDLIWYMKAACENTFETYKKTYAAAKARLRQQHASDLSTDAEAPQGAPPQGAPQAPPSAQEGAP
ncbi:hypothetical protein Emed_005489 [Eimeria media]